MAILNIVKENKLFIHVSHPWPFPYSNGKQVITPVPLKISKKRKVKKTKKKVKPQYPRSWVPALF